MAKSLQEASDDGFNSAICYVLGYLNGVGQGGSTVYEEILEGADKEQIITYARKNGEMRFTGLTMYLRRQKENRDG